MFLSVPHGISHELPSDTLNTVSRGLGKTQQRILDELAGIEPPEPGLAPFQGNYALTVTTLAERIGISDGQTRRAVRALEQRDLLVITRGSVLRGEGKYGPLVRRQSLFNNYSDEVPTAHTVMKGEPWPWSPDRLMAARDVELVHAGMPTVALWVWSLKNRVAYLAAESQSIIRFGGAPSEELMDEYCRLTGLGEDAAQKIGRAFGR